MVGAGPSFCEDFENPSSPGWPGMPVSGSGRDVFHTVICCYWEQFVIFILFPYPFPFLPPKKEEEKRKEKKEEEEKPTTKKPPNVHLLHFSPLSFFLLVMNFSCQLLGMVFCLLYPPPHPM